jgi:hypothetical protein
MKTILFYLIVLFSFSICSAKKYVVNVASYKNDVEPAKGNKCFVYGRDMNQNSAEVKGYCNYIKTILIGKKYTIVDSREEADVIVGFDYSISEPKTVYETVNTLMFGVVGQSSSTTGTARIDNYSNTVRYSGNTRSNPIYGVTGVNSQQRSVTVYDKSFILDATANPSKEGVAIWAIKSISRGYALDMRISFPYILTAVSKYIDKSSGGQKRVTIQLVSAKVDKLKAKTIKNQYKLRK